MKISNEIKDKYEFERNTFVRKDKGEINEEREVEIGDILQDNFIPQLKLKQWDNETNMSVRLIDDGTDKPQIKTEGNKIKFIKNKIEAHFYEIENGFEFDIVLKEKPKSNIQTLSMQTKGLKFSYQPPLTEEITEEEKAKGWTATETDIKDEKGNVVCHRPENVVGSYAVYHESKQGDYSQMGLKNYQAGKAFHWYRIKAWDKNGTEVWCKLNVDVEKGARTVEIPQDFLDNAVYPVVIDDILGYWNNGTQGASSYRYTNTSIERIQGTKWTAGVNGTISSITSYHKIELDPVNAIGAIYETTNRLDYMDTEHHGNEGPDWFTENAAIGASLVASTDYWIVYVFGDLVGVNRAFTYYYDAGSNSLDRQNITYSYPPPATWSKSYFADRNVSVYVTYGAGGGAGNLKSSNSIAFASIKSKNSVAIANIKSINGVTTT